jgi:hypothetical protein
MSREAMPSIIATIGIDIGKNTFPPGRLRSARGDCFAIEGLAGATRAAGDISRCLIDIEACSGAHHIGRQLAALGHEVRLIAGSGPVVLAPSANAGAQARFPRVPADGGNRH